jgi:VIT1/CCC1 family predicted Fe2+/Mn2+ transporter
MVELITQRKDVWLNTMLAEEYGRTEVQRSPSLAAFSTFVAFVICGSVPLIPFVFDLGNSAIWATSMTAAVFFGIGTVKSRWSLQAWWLSGLETLGIGLTAAGIAYFVGVLLSGLVGGAA